MIEQKRNTFFEKFNRARNSILSKGISQLYLYESLALKKRLDEFKKYNVPIYHNEYTPNPYHYQYDLELYIFINYDELKNEELEIRSGFNNSKETNLIEEYGATLIPREKHVANAASIRWPSKISPDGRFIGDLALHQWILDFFYGLSNYKNVVEFGGGGQGKTYAPLAFMCMIYDYFMFTKHGAQCTFSTVSKDKLTGSTWKYLNTLYGVKTNNRHEYSLTAQLAKRAGDFEYRRIDDAGKYHNEGGIIKGVLLQKGTKDARVTDKLTGYHSPEARIYLLDEAQSTDDAPLDAYNNMFLHPRYGWFFMSGNYYSEGDLLDRNAEPDIGWGSVDELTHMWKGTLKTFNESLDQECLVIHYNNDISPGMLDKDVAKLYGRFIPTKEKKERQYPTLESRSTEAYKRFWVGFKFMSSRDSSEYVLTDKLVESFDCHKPKPEDFQKHFTIGSFDSAPASVDRNVFTCFDIGVTSDGLPMVIPTKIYSFPKPKEDLKYYTETCNNIISVCKRHNIEPNQLITDWSARTALVEMLAQKGYTCYPLSYQEKLVKKLELNPRTGIYEDVIRLEKIKSWVNPSFEKEITYYAHDRIVNKITLGAYVMRMFFEKGRVREFNANLLTGVNFCEKFEKEFFRRKFEKKTRLAGEFISLDSKDAFNDEHNFSPDYLDTFFQAFYLIYVYFKIRPDTRGLGVYRKKTNKKRIDNFDKMWHNKQM